MSECKIDGCWGECKQHSTSNHIDMLDTATYNYIKSAKTVADGLFKKLDQTATYGTIGPTTILVSPKTFSVIKSKLQTQQKFASSEPAIGFAGLKYGNATIIPSKDTPHGTLTSITHNGNATQVSIDDLGK